MQATHAEALRLQQQQPRRMTSSQAPPLFAGLLTTQLQLPRLNSSRMISLLVK
jgi:hypothetical protein